MQIIIEEKFRENFLFCSNFTSFSNFMLILKLFPTFCHIYLQDDDSESLLTLDDHGPTISNRQFQRQKTLQQVDLDLPFLDDPRIEKNEQAKYLEQEINEQAKVVEDLQKLGASEQTVATEMSK